MLCLARNVIAKLKYDKIKLRLGTNYAKTIKSKSLSNNKSVALASTTEYANVIPYTKICWYVQKVTLCIVFVTVTRGAFRQQNIKTENLLLHKGHDLAVSLLGKSSAKRTLQTSVLITRSQLYWMLLNIICVMLLFSVQFRLLSASSCLN